MVRAITMLLGLAMFLAAYMLIIPNLMEPLIETFLGYSYMTTHTTLMRDLETVMYRWVPLTTIFVMFVIAAIWVVRKRRFVGTRTSNVRRR